MTVTTETGEALARLRERTALATRLWGRMFSGLTAITYREKGEAATHRLWHDVLRGHQTDRYREGLEKLGIHRDPPAVAAAKYHYFTNLIGGLSMEYVEESPRKVWIRYTAPMWTYDGIAMLALPPSIRRTIFSAWHPRNGELMGCPRLGYVHTKFIMDGEPYDEGYFIEHDHALAPEERMRIEHVDRAPEFDPARAPVLDPTAWPEARMLKARRNFSAGYVRETVRSLTDTHGEAAACYIVQQTMRCLAVQYTHEFRERLGIAGNDAPAAAALLAGLLAACEQRYTLEPVSAARRRIVLESFKPLGDGASEALRDAMFHFQRGIARVMSGRLRVSRGLAEPGVEVWQIEDAGRWLY